MDALTKWLETGSLNKENFYVNEDAPAPPSGHATISVGGSFDFTVMLSSPFALTVARPSELQKDFVKRVSSTKPQSLSDVLNAATKFCVDAMEFEDTGSGCDVDDALDEAMSAPGPGSAFSMQQELRRLGESYDVQTLTKPAAERILRDMKQLRDVKHDGWKAAPIGRDLSTWSIELFDFEKGTQLEKDMQAVAKRTGKAAVEMRMTFPKEYPFKPPFIRVVRPRFVFRTGRITVGGSICTQLLTDEGWNPIFDVEAIIVTVRQQITDPSSNAQIDHSSVSDYTEQEARSAFERVAAEHKAKGWD